jgi:hypothetical protein
MTLRDLTWLGWSGVEWSGLLFLWYFFFFCSEPSIAFIDRVGSGLVLVSGRLLVGWLIGWVRCMVLAAFRF